MRKHTVIHANKYSMYTKNTACMRISTKKLKNQILNNLKILNKISNCISTPFSFPFQVSFFSTSPELSNKQRFEYFSRTIPSDHYQVKAMVEIVMRLGWSYISIIYEESNYGVKAFEELEELLAENNICIAVKEKLVKDSGVAPEKGYDSIVQKLLTKSRARGEFLNYFLRV